MKTWLVLNLLAYGGVYLVAGWHGVGMLVLLEVVGSVLLGAVFVYGLAGREERSARRIRDRFEALRAERDHPWRGPR